MDTMRTTIDKAGRLVIPRILRNRVGLGAGGEVDIEVDGAGLRIEPVTGAELREVDGLLIISAPGLFIDDALVRDLVDEDRYRH
jgi:AbrB family looped-hinge helix DNA binding protein